MGIVSSVTTREAPQEDASRKTSQRWTHVRLHETKRSQRRSGPQEAIPPLLEETTEWKEPPLVQRRKSRQEAIRAQRETKRKKEENGGVAPKPKKRKLGKRSNFERRKTHST